MSKLTPTQVEAVQRTIAHFTSTSKLDPNLLDHPDFHHLVEQVVEYSFGRAGRLLRRHLDPALEGAVAPAWDAMSVELAQEFNDNPTLFILKAITPRVEAT